MYVWVQTAVLAFGGQQRDWVSPVALHLVPLRQGILWKLNVVFSARLTSSSFCVSPSLLELQACGRPCLVFTWVLGSELCFLPAQQRS